MLPVLKGKENVNSYGRTSLMWNEVVNSKNFTNAFVDTVTACGIDRTVAKFLLHFMVHGLLFYIPINAGYKTKDKNKGSYMHYLLSIDDYKDDDKVVQKRKPYMTKAHAVAKEQLAMEISIKQQKDKQKEMNRKHRENACIKCGSAAFKFDDYVYSQYCGRSQCEEVNVRNGNEF